MDINIEQKILSEASAWASRTLAARSTDFIISSIVLEARTEGILDLYVYDYNMFTKCSVQAEVKTAGIAIVPGKIFADIAKNISSDFVTLSANEKTLRVEGGNFSSNLPLINTEEYPELPGLPESNLKFQTADFLNAISQTYIATSREEDNQSLSAIKIKLEGDKAEFLATDRYRFARKLIPFNSLSEPVNCDLLLPRKEAGEIAKSLESSSEIEVGLKINAEKVIFASFVAGSKQIGTTTFDANFPNVETLLDAEHEIKATVDRETFIAAIKRVALVLPVDSHIKISFASNKFLITAAQENSSNAQEEIDGITIGSELTVAFNPGYLLDGLNALQTKFASLRMNNETAPVEIIGQNSIDEDAANDYCYVLVPVRI